MATLDDLEKRIDDLLIRYNTQAMPGWALRDYLRQELTAAEQRGIERAAVLCDEEVQRWRDNLENTHQADYDPKMRDRNVARARHWIMQCFRLSTRIRAL